MVNVLIKMVMFIISEQLWLNVVFIKIVFMLLVEKQVLIIIEFVIMFIKVGLRQESIGSIVGLSV